MNNLNMDNNSLIKKGFHTEYFSTGWMAFEFLVGFISGLKAGSILLIAFGLDSLLEIVSGSALIWRLHKSAEHAEESVIKHAERTSSLIVGTVLLALSVYITVISVFNLITHRAAENSPSGMAIAIASVILMPILTLRKRKLGKLLKSKALIEDGMCNITCACMAATVLIGTALNAAFGLWWSDSVMAFVLVYFIASEGWESFQNGRKPK
ncbi:cation transporter [Acetilactobacillus jinshanensis]|uniref:Cation transporter n=1 Tax=Acetilactobacillus jinshanensis TaxID=1720083 RepID=A0A4P6ZLY8_9LACO|nr:cation transporter [Acetilactobacillus jinshanensis]QBP18587.1 cation transporter [Acetilactobacillus jinshanensis]URL61463.1 cation transporter [uncultured bacterium]